MFRAIRYVNVPDSSLREFLQSSLSTNHLPVLSLPYIDLSWDCPDFYSLYVFDLKFYKYKAHLANKQERIGANIYGVLIALTHEVSESLKEGGAKGAMELGDLCSFYPALQSSGSDTAEDFLATTHIKRKGEKVRASRSSSAQLAEKRLNGINGIG